MRDIGLLTVAPAPVPDTCRAAEDGAPCSAEAFMRGLCRRHYPAVKSRGLLGQIGLPPARSKYDIRLKAPDQLQPGICRVIVNGEACLVPAQRRGLCDRHYAAIWQRPDLTLDDFAASPISSGDFRLRRKPPPDCCRVVERDVPCDALPHARGLCKMPWPSFLISPNGGIAGWFFRVTPASTLPSRVGMPCGFWNDIPATALAN